MTMKAHTYYITFGRPPIGGSFPPPPGGATDGREWIAIQVHYRSSAIVWHREDGFIGSRAVVTNEQNAVQIK